MSPRNWPHTYLALELQWHKSFFHLFWHTTLLCFLLLWQAQWLKASWGGKGWFHLTAYIASRTEVRAGTPSRNLEAGTGEQKPRRNMASCLAVRLTYIPLSYSMASPRGAWGGTTHIGLGPPILIIIQENVQQTCPQANLKRGSSAEVPVPQMALVCVKLTEN